MVAELGIFALIFALLISIFQGIIPLYGAQTNKSNLIAYARPLAYTALFVQLVAIFTLGICFYLNDFSVLYVANHSNSILPTFYRISAIWGGHEGSLLLWITMLSLWGGLVAFFSKSIDEVTVARVISIIGLVSIGLILFTIATSNPFARIIPPASEGRDLNPLLQDPGLIFHPPLLYMGYVGLSVAFAFAITALISGKFDIAWARWMRPWTILAWIFLSLGIILGSWWAYYELGWGGWWFWDPVENASLMPWIIATALIHSLVVTEKSGSFKTWTVLLAILAFSLSLLGTFLVRSGVLTSVHAFAVDPTRGLFILIFLSIVIGSSLLLFALRAHKVSLGSSFNIISRESFILIGNVILVVIFLVVLLGTLYPLIIDALIGKKISVGPPYFNSVIIPISFLAFLFCAITPMIKWKNDTFANLVKKSGLLIIISLVSGVVILVFYRSFSILGFLGISMAILIFLSVSIQTINRFKIGKPPLKFIGMILAHLGVAILIFGITMVSLFAQQKTVKMKTGDVVELKDYQFKLKKIQTINGPNYTSNLGEFVLSKNKNEIARLYPEKRSYFSSTMVMTEAAINTKFTRDAYISLGEPLENNAWLVTVHIKPFVFWIWMGVIIFSLGGVIAICDRGNRI